MWFPSTLSGTGGGATGRQEKTQQFLPLYLLSLNLSILALLLQHIVLFLSFQLLIVATHLSLVSCFWFWYLVSDCWLPAPVLIDRLWAVFINAALLLLSFFSRHFVQQLTRFLKVGKCTNWKRKNLLSPPLLPWPHPPDSPYFPGWFWCIVLGAWPASVLTCRPPSHLSLANFLPAILYGFPVLDWNKFYSVQLLFQYILHKVSPARQFTNSFLSYSKVTLFFCLFCVIISRPFVRLRVLCFPRRGEFLGAFSRDSVSCV